MSKRGIEAVREEEPADPQNFIFPALPNELYAHHIYPSLDATTLVAMFRVSARFRDLVVPPAAWQRQIERYFPALKEVFPEEFEKNPYQLFVKEYKRHQRIIKDERRNISMISVLAALNGEMAEIEKVQGRDKLLLLSLMLSNGYSSVLKLVYQDDGDGEAYLTQDGVTIISAATRFAALAGNKTVFDRLLRHLLLDSSTDSQIGEVCKEYFRHSLTSGRIEMAKYLMEKYIQPLRLTPEQNSQFLNNTALTLFLVTEGYKKNRSLAVVQYLCSFKDDAGRPIIATDILERGILEHAAEEGDLEIFKFILSLKDKEHHPIYTVEDFPGPDTINSRVLLELAAKNNQSEMFEYIYKTYDPQLGPHYLKRMMVASAGHPSPSYSIVALIAGLKDADGKYIIDVNAIGDCLCKGIRVGKHDLVAYLFAERMDMLFNFSELIPCCFETEAWVGHPGHWIIREKVLMQENDILTLQVILNSIPSVEMVKSVYDTLIQRAFRFYDKDASKFFDLISKIKDPENKPYSRNKKLMMDAMLLLPFKAIQHPCVTDFVNALTDDEFNQIKTAAMFYGRSDIVGHVQAVRHQENQMSSEVSVISVNPESEPPAKRARFTF